MGKGKVNVVLESETFKSGTFKKELFEWLYAILVAFCLTFFLRTFVFSLVAVEGESMEPTLIAGDKLYVSKLSKKPKRGDIVVVASPEPVASKRLYIKRVIAVEDDHLYIDFDKGEVYLNDHLIQEPYINNPTFLSESYIKQLFRNGQYNKQSPIFIGKDEIFLMGDNRLRSHDSRGFGPVNVSSVKGKAVFRIWPFDKFGLLTKFEF